MINDLERIEAQKKFYRDGLAGCLYAAYAAKRPDKLGWRFVVVNPRAEEIDEAIRAAIVDESTSTLSLIVRQDDVSAATLAHLIRELKKCSTVWCETETAAGGDVLFGFRARVAELTSWISGFGPLPFLPETRQAPQVELALRCKPRPNYKMVMKEAPPGVIHLADMHLLDMGARKFKMLWDGSFAGTKRRLGHAPDMLSAAKTTFILPKTNWP